MILTRLAKLSLDLADDIGELINKKSFTLFNNDLV
ncbi:hypothetical protein HNQ62_002547 [Sulfurisphaera ohwakuensis]|uniref:Uncharacterized protein n=1 Tax=Sulfurisphaera ohwakuensis TaxID=69656 RepID=A0A7J9RUY0_SULOH|nr:hypothetical protein [Sulfurisphaera ohwakuensis]